MSIILVDKNKLNLLLNERLNEPLVRKPKSVTGDQASASIASAQASVDKVKSNLASLNIHSIPELEGVNTIEQLSIEPFKFQFLLQVTDAPQELTIPKPYPYKTLARVIETEPLTLECKLEDSNSPTGVADLTWKMVFSNEDELVTRLPGTKKEIKAIVARGNDKGNFYTIEFGDEDIKKVVDISKEEEGGEEGEGEEGGKEKEGDEKNKDKGGKDDLKKSNIYNGKDLKEVNLKLNDVKDKAKFFSIIKNYKTNEEFQDIFLDAFISVSDKALTINKKPIAKSLKDFKNNGLLEAEPMSGLKRKFLVVKRNLQNFMFEVFSLFAKLNKSGRDSQTFKVIKEFYKQLFIITRQGQSAISDKQKRKMLFKKLYGNFSNFCTSFYKLPEMIKGKKNKEEGKEVKVKSQPKATLSTVESFIYQISKSVSLLTEEGEEEGDSSLPSKQKNITGKIYANSIELGPKAKARRGADMQSYAESRKRGSSKWDGTLANLPANGFESKVSLDFSSVSNLTDDQKTALKEIQTNLNAQQGLFQKNALIRKSKKDTNNTLFIVEFEGIGGGTKALVCKTDKPNQNLYNKSNITLGRNAGGREVLTDSIKIDFKVS